MNNRRRALIASASRTVAKSDDSIPASLCASSAITRSNAGTRPTAKAAAICGDDW